MRLRERFPGGRLVGAVRVRPRMSPARRPPRMLPPGCLELAFEKKGVSQVVMRRRVRGRETDRLAVAADGFVEVPGRLVVQVTQVVVDRSVPRIDGERALV